MIDGLAAVFVLELKQLLRGRKILVLSLLLLGVGVLGFVVRYFGKLPEDRLWPVVYVLIMSFVFLQTLVLMVPLLFMTSILRDEIEEGTLVYLFTRPVPKSLVLAAKFLAAFLLAGTALFVGMTLFHIGFTLPGEAGAVDFPWARTWGRFVFSALMGLFTYGAIFAFVGLVSKRPLIWGIAYGFLAEFILTNIPAFIKKITVMYYLRSFALNGLLDLEGLEAREALDLLDLTGPLNAVLVTSIAAVVFLAFSGLVVTFKEFGAGKLVSE